MNTKHRTVVIGTGLAGVRCATTLRRLDPDRSVLLVGDELHDAYERPPLSKHYLIGSRSAPDLTLAGSRRNELTTAGIDIRAGMRAVALERGCVVMENGERVDGDQVVLATGARARRFPVHADADRMHVLRTLDDADRLRDALTPGCRLVIVGSGFIGTEVAASASERGAQVTLVEAAPIPFERTLGADAGIWLVDRWRRSGIELHIGTGVDEILDGDPTTAPLVVRLADGRLLPADHVLVAIGTIPNDELFHAAFPGIGSLGAGTPTDQDGRTAVDGVYAVGDVALVARDQTGARRVEHWTDAATGAIRLAQLLAGRSPGPRPAPYAWSDQFGLRVQVVGDVDPSYAAIIDDAGAESLLVRYLDAHGVLRGVAAVGHPRDVARYRQQLTA